MSVYQMISFTKQYFYNSREIFVGKFKIVSQQCLFLQTYWGAILIGVT